MDITDFEGKEFNDYLKEHKDLKRVTYNCLEKFTNKKIVDNYVHKFEGPLPGINIGKSMIREYVDQILDKNFEKNVSDFIEKLRDIYYKKKQKTPAKAKRRIVSGFREVHKKIKLNEVKFVFIVPNIEKVEGKHGLDEKIIEIFNMCKAKNIPIFFGLNKFKLGYICRKKNSCISIAAIINVEGFEHDLSKLTEEGFNFKSKFYENFYDKKEIFKENKFINLDMFNKIERKREENIK